ncbi:MAG TPA: GTP-binding protein, partial [Bradyrhizobium sp.]|nr:GTP-binding protein [Bradyrhizobium sp.]
RSHRQGLVSIALQSDQPVDADEFMAWIQDVIQTCGKDLLRSKGILAFADEPRRFVFQGVQSLLDGDVQEPWGRDEPRTSKLVLIGRNLDEEAIRAGFAACRADLMPSPKRSPDGRSFPRKTER